jgi:hypothetical protein
MTPALSGDQAMKVILFLSICQFRCPRVVCMVRPTGCPRRMRARTERRKRRSGGPGPQRPGSQKVSHYAQLETSQTACPLEA